MGQPSSKDVGKRAIYNYHVNEQIENKKVSMEIVENWYPQSYHQKEIFILSKIRKLCNGFDGRDIKVSDQELPLLFMTAEWNTTKNGKYIQNRNQILRRAISRFDDFEHQGYITGTYGRFQFTFSGMKKLEDLVIMKPDINQNIEQVIEEIRKENEKSSTRYEELISVLQDIKNTPKNYGEYISDLANIATIGSIIPSAVPKVGKLLGRLISVL